MFATSICYIHGFVPIIKTNRCIISIIGTHTKEFLNNILSKKSRHAMLHNLYNYYSSIVPDSFSIKLLPNNVGILASSLPAKHKHRTACYVHNASILGWVMLVSDQYSIVNHSAY